jgi:hypothetical protein
VKEWRRSRIERYAMAAEQRRVATRPKGAESTSAAKTVAQEVVDELQKQDSLGRSSWHTMAEALSDVRRSLNGKMGQFRSISNVVEGTMKESKRSMNQRKRRYPLRLRDLDSSLSTESQHLPSDCLSLPMWPRRRTLLANPIDADIASYRWRKSLEEAEPDEPQQSDIDRIRSDLQLAKARLFSGRPLG